MRSENLSSKKRKKSVKQPKKLRVVDILLLFPGLVTASLMLPVILVCFGQLVSATGVSEKSCPAIDPVDRTILLPNPEDCSSFFMCSNGVPILQNCPNELRFNANLSACDWPEKAGCELGNYCCVDLALCILISRVEK
jgi:hypothetical protein